MLVKSVTRDLKNPELHQLIKYVNEKRESFKNEPHFCLRYNTTGNTAKEIAKDFERNNKFIKKRKGKQVGVYHFILSFHPKEKHLLDDAKLFDFGQKFCELIEADKAIVFARPHWEKHNAHLHFSVSASAYGSGASRRLSKAKWKQIQIAINKHQKEHYKELKHWLLYLPELEKSRESNLGIPLPKGLKETDGSIRSKQRGKVSQLETVRNQLLTIAKEHPKKQDFIKAINREKRFSVYYRGNSDTPTGVITERGKKYRFKRLALDIENLQRDVRLNDLKIQQEKSRDNER